MYNKIVNIIIKHKNTILMNIHYKWFNRNEMHLKKYKSKRNYFINGHLSSFFHFDMFIRECNALKPTIYLSRQC